MITTDNDAIIKIEKKLNVFLPTIENKIYKMVLNLLKKYSYVENQTYSRPSHPLEEKRKDVFFTMASIIISLRTTLENEQKASKALMYKLGI
jgi:endonuclease III